MGQSNFGVGLLFAIPTGATPTPIMLGALQDVAIDPGFDLKELYGSFQFPIEVARGKGKMPIKATLGHFDPVMFNAVMFGLSTTNSENRNSSREAGTIPSTPFQLTAANATFAVNLGVYDVTKAKWLTRVSAGPATGQYSLNTGTGVYTFAAADVGDSVQLYYTYTPGSPVSTAASLAITNQLMGAGVSLALNLVNYNQVTGKYLNWTFPNVQCVKLSMPMKLDDYTMASLEFQAYDDGAGNISTVTMTGGGVGGQ